MSNSQNQLGVSSVWGTLSAAPADPILGLNEAFKKDTRGNKSLLGMGAYRTDEGKPFILGCVKEAERRILAAGMNHEYSGIDGIPSYRQKCIKLAYGADSDLVKSNRVAAMQSISGTGSLRVGFEFLKAFYPISGVKVWIPNPSWPTHKKIAEKCGFETATYRYYDKSSRSFDLAGMLEDLSNAPDQSIVMFHACAHNPTGCDPSKDDWHKIFEVVAKKGHFAAFDSAYQGFASGNLETDAYSLRYFSQRTDRMCLFQSFAKNFGLYGERAGCVSFLASSAEEAARMVTRMKTIARPMYSNPPIHGARIVDIILGDAELTAAWHQDLLTMSGRMKEMRAGLVQNLKDLGNPHDWSHVITQIGMFAFTGLNVNQVTELREKYGIYMTNNGRISMAGLNNGNLKYIAKAFHNVTKDAGLGQ